VFPWLAGLLRWVELGVGESGSVASFSSPDEVVLWSGTITAMTPAGIEASRDHGAPLAELVGSC